MPAGKAIYANVLGINVPLGGGSGGNNVDPSTFSTSGNGYYVLPSGLILNWGKVPNMVYNESTVYTANFAKAFPHKCFNVMASIGNGSGRGADEVMVVSFNNSSARLKGCYDDDYDTVDTYWLAIGY